MCYFTIWWYDHEKSCVKKYRFMLKPYLEHLIFSLVTIIGRFYSNSTNIFKKLNNNYEKSTKVLNILKIRWKIRLIGRCRKEWFWKCEIIRANRGAWIVTGIVICCREDVNNLKTIFVHFGGSKLHFCSKIILKLSRQRKTISLIFQCTRGITITFPTRIFH